MYVMNTTDRVFATNITPGKSVQLWLWTDFVGVPGGTAVQRNASIAAVKFKN
jgi:hypothetical protein